MWQEIVVALIGIITFAIVIRYVAKSVKQPSECNSCADDCSQCPLKTKK